MPEDVMEDKVETSLRQVCQLAALCDGRKHPDCCHDCTYYVTSPFESPCGRCGRPGAGRVSTSDVMVCDHFMNRRCLDADGFLPSAFNTDAAGPGKWWVRSPSYPPSGEPVKWKHQTSKHPVLHVIDTKTGGYPCVAEIARTEDWAEGLIYCDMWGFALMEDGLLVLLDECGNYRVCPEGRFEVEIRDV